ncbi:MAG: F0F1 ATP synthase subunit gamma [Gammaproteobacteria bacterium]|nr:F0F1 ATP synthase subunit gamma [Gammaproteobacteria bacterium]
MSTAREIRSKIGSIKNTQKITQAMELVAASKMRKAQERMAKSQPYSREIRRVISHVAASSSEYKHPYLQSRDEIKRVGFIVISTDRGLCGGLNVNLLRATLKKMREFSEQDIGIDLCLIGRKAEQFFRRHGGKILGMATQLGDQPAEKDLIGVVKVMLDEFDSEKLDAIYIASNQFVTTMEQHPTVRQLLPLEPDESQTHGHWDYIYEPDSARELLSLLLVRYIESQVYQGVVDNLACEQAARMVAMQSATENAGEIIKDLQLIYNKARQASITQEIAEIVSGAAAVE